MSGSLDNVARTKSVLGAPGEALALYAESLGLSRALAAELGTPESRRDVAVSCERLGDHAWRQLHDPAGAERYFSEALTVWRQLNEWLDIPNTKRWPAVVLIRLVGLAEEQGERGTALTLAEEGLRLARAYAAAVGDLPDARQIVDWSEAAVTRLR